MKIYKEERLRNFEFWSGACDRVKYLTDEELDTIESILEECNPEGMTETEINDFFLVRRRYYRGMVRIFEF